LQPEASNPQAYGDDLAAARSIVLGAVSTAQAATDHNDLLAAVSMAADQAHQTAPTGTQILIVDNGLSDTGAMNLARPGMTAADPSEVGAFVQGNGGCPANLAGTTMTMYGAGYGVDPQPLLSQQQITAVGRIWQDTIKACGGQLILAPTPRTEPGPDTPFTVTPVPPSPDAVMPAASGSVLTFGDGGALRFKPDSADLVDPTAAASALQPVADHLRTDPAHAVTIAGTTSNGPTAWSSYTELARARAQTVAAILITAFSIQPRQIHCVGMGYISDPPVVDPATAALNRTTRISIDT
jgi:outer membrane protein OmpA-like peptidoglycan-associated protein